MARGTITPWRNHSDLLSVRQQLYSKPSSSSPSSPDPRAHAVQRVMAWKARGNLPHAVESTALLLDAILHHHQPANPNTSSFSIRAVYSAAFTRFVTGFCDIGRSKERNLEPSSMLEIARQIDMPVDFVTLRHEATHQELPEIHRLVQATEDALDWLWNAYWSRLEDPMSVEAMAARKEFQKDVRVRLREFRSARRDALRNAKAVSGTGERDQEFWKAARPVVEMVKNAPSNTSALVDTLLEEKWLVPSKRELGSPLGGAFLLWDRLLQDIFLEQERFVPQLVQGMLSHIERISTNSSLPQNDADAEAICLWLAHFADPKGWTAITVTEKKLLQDHILTWCCSHPGYWAHDLGQRMLELGDAQLRSVWGDLLRASQLAYEDSEVDAVAKPVSLPAQEDVEMSSTSSFSTAEDIPSGWTRRAARPTLPLGCS